jgi:preprotein translocase subunit YajC
MMPWFQQFCLLAEDAPSTSPLMWMIPALLIFFLFQMFFSSSPQRREQKHIEHLKSTLKKNDPVVTAGGIMGTVAIVSPEKQEVTIKVDDNTRLRVQMRSILALPKEEVKDKDTKPGPPPGEIK